MKLIYIDPPYNTGSDSFNYNDKFNHSTWLTFMQNRLKVAREFLHDDGVIFIQCDDNEQAYLKVLCDEIFGRENFVACFVWEKKRVRQNDARFYSTNHEYIINYAKKKENFKPNPLERTEEMIKAYKNPDNDPRGVWVAIPLSAKSGTEAMRYKITFPNGVNYETKFGYPRYSKEKLLQLYEDNRLYFGKNGNSQPSAKKFLSEVRNGVVHNTLLNMDDVGSTQKSASEIKALFAPSLRESETNEAIHISESKQVDCHEATASRNDEVEINDSNNAESHNDKNNETTLFATPKPEALLKRIIEIATNKGDLVMDFFAGSGTTLAVAHKMQRRWIGIEQMDYVESITKERLKKVVSGEQGGVSKALNWQGGGGFIYTELMPLNAVYREKILESSDEKELEKLYNDLESKAFTNYRVDIQEMLKDKNAQKDKETNIYKEFHDLSLEEKKGILYAILDPNMDYVPYSEIEDKSYGVSDELIELNRIFYSEGDFSQPFNEGENTESKGGQDE